MKDKNYKIFKDAISNLPKYRLPDADLWNKIGHRLDNSPEIFSELPSFKAPEVIWNNLEQKLNEIDQKNKNTRTLFLKFSVAASIAAIIALGVWRFYPWRNTNETLTHSVEILINDENNEDTDDKMLSDLNTLLAQNCKSNPVVCSTKSFKNLEKTLNEIDKEYGDLKKEIQKSNDNQLYKYLYRLENERVSIQKELLQMFNKI